MAFISPFTIPAKVLILFIILLWFMFIFVFFWDLPGYNCKFKTVLNVMPSKIKAINTPKLLFICW